MRLAVLDVGSNTVNMLVTDSDTAVPLRVRAWKSRISLSETLQRDGAVGVTGRRRVIAAVRKAADEARRLKVDALFPYATAVVRDAPNREQILGEVADAVGIRLGWLSGVEEARLTFLAARRWLGWRAGPLLLADIGGGSLEVAVGPDRLPDVALSLPLGARQLTRRFLGDGGRPCSPRAVRKLRQHVREQIDEVVTSTPWEPPRMGVATSKTFQQLARLTGAPALREGPFVSRELRRKASPVGAFPAGRWSRCLGSVACAGASRGGLPGRRHRSHRVAHAASPCR
jgi:exopolyphosphatase / guanosine-5'-triphosphate,3'-diphosphate pyrophosphatase